MGVLFLKSVTSEAGIVALAFSFVGKVTNVVLRLKQAATFGVLVNKVTSLTHP